MGQDLGFVGGFGSTMSMGSRLFGFVILGCLGYGIQSMGLTFLWDVFVNQGLMGLWVFGKWDGSCSGGGYKF